MLTFRTTNYFFQSLWADPDRHIFVHSNIRTQNRKTTHKTK